MIADVVVWKAVDELPFDELQEAINWVLEAMGEPIWNDWTGSGAPKVFVHSPPQRQMNGYGGRGSGKVAFREPYFCIIVSNEQVDDVKAYALWDQYEAQFTEGGDANESQGPVEGSEGTGP